MNFFIPILADSQQVPTYTNTIKDLFFAFRWKTKMSRQQISFVVKKSQDNLNLRWSQYTHTHSQTHTHTHRIMFWGDSFARNANYEIQKRYTYESDNPVKVGSF